MVLAVFALLTSETVVRVWVFLVTALKSLERQQVEIPLVCVVLLQVADLAADVDVACGRVSMLAKE